MNIILNTKQQYFRKENILRKPKQIQIITSESQNWKILKVDDEIIYKGGIIPEGVFLNLLSRISGTVTKYTYISDEAMEKGEY